MKQKFKQLLDEIPILKKLVKLEKRMKIPGLHGLTLFNVIELYVIGIIKGAFTARASGIAFSFFMALFPFLLFILTLIPFVPIDGFQEDFLASLQDVMPPNTAESVDGVIKDIINTRYGGLLSFGFLASIFLMTNGVNAIFSGFENSYHIKKIRNVIKQYFISMGMAILLSIILLATVAVNIYFALGVNDLKVHGWLTNEGSWIKFGSVLFFISLTFISVSFLYKFGTIETKKISSIPGAILTTLLTLLMSKLFAIYVVQFSQYNELYGSIGTLLIVMLFLWINSMNLLLGFELNATINRLKQKQQNNRVLNVIAMIPARFEASRFPGKLMKDLAGKSVILRTYEATKSTNLFDEVFVITDSDVIYNEVVNNGGKAIKSKKEHESGSDRIAEAVENLKVDVVVNVQGDEPFTQKEPLENLLAAFRTDVDKKIDIASLKIKMDDEAEINNPNNVKVVCDEDDFALYFSRASIPFPREQSKAVFYKHIGIYAFRKEALLKFTQLPINQLEATEKLENLRFLANGFKVKMVETDQLAIGIDTPEDLEKANVIFNQHIS